MRCDCCNRPLNDFESTLKSLASLDYLNTCQSCLDGLGIETLGRPDLNPNDDAPEDWDWDDLTEEQVDFLESE